jgi:UPF0716 protein FxsA
MVYVLIALFIVMPILELAAFVQVADWIGFLPSLVLIVVFSVSGAWLVKQEGISVWRRAQAQLGRGELPAAELLNGLLLLVAGALMLVPGFITDAFGLLLLLPPTRALVRMLLLRRFAKRLQAAFVATGVTGVGSPDGFSTTRVVTGTATYGDVPVTGTSPGMPPPRGAVVDVHEVDADAAGSSPGTTDEPDEPPALGRS